MKHFKPLESQTQNSVKLALPDYLDLYEFKRNIEEKKLVCKLYGTYNSIACNNYEYLTLDIAVEEVIKINKNLIKTADEHAKIVYDLQNHIRTLNETAIKNNIIAKGSVPNSNTLHIDDIKKFSIWQFIKWRKRK